MNAEGSNAPPTFCCWRPSLLQVGIAKLRQRVDGNRADQKNRPGQHRSGD